MVDPLNTLMFHKWLGILRAPSLHLSFLRGNYVYAKSSYYTSWF
jgi:hypothetical protein